MKREKLRDSDIPYGDVPWPEDDDAGALIIPFSEDQALGAEPARYWPAALPLWETEDPDLPPFPLDALPTVPRAFAKALAQEAQLPIEGATMMALASIAAAAQRSGYIEIHAGWPEPLSLWVLYIANSGELKSTGISRSTKPHGDWEVAQRGDFLKCKAHHDLKIETLEGQLRDGGLSTADRIQAMAALEGLRSECPAEPLVYAEDVTPESLIRIAAGQDGAISLFTAEGAILETVMGVRYSSSGAPNMTALIKGYSGESVRVDRANGTRIHVPRLRISLVTSTQPDTLMQLSSIRGARGQGTLARFLLTPHPIPSEVLASWSSLIRALLDIPRGEELRRIVCTEDAKTAVLELKQQIEHELRPGGSLAGVVDWANKLAGHLVRVAGVLALAEDPQATRLEREWVERAKRFKPHLVASAKRALGSSGVTDPAVVHARAIAEHLHESKISTTSRPQLHTKLRGRAWVTRAADLDPALDLLVQRGWLRPLAPEYEGRGRPQTTRYELHPELIAGRLLD